MQTVATMMMCILQIHTLFEWLVDPCIAFVRRNCRELVITADINLPVSLMNLFSSLLDCFKPNAGGEPPVSAPAITHCAYASLSIDVQLNYRFWAAWNNTWLPIRLTPKGVVFFFHFSLTTGYSACALRCNEAINMNASHACQPLSQHLSLWPMLVYCLHALQCKQLSRLTTIVTICLAVTWNAAIRMSIFSRVTVISVSCEQSCDLTVDFHDSLWVCSRKISELIKVDG